ncbi:MAG: hypothetical protein ACYDD1_06160 [Caulobacteraceae bacterium]
MSRRVAAVTALVLLTASVAAAQTQRFEVTVRNKTEGYGKIDIDKAAIGSAPIRLWQNTAVEPDCTPHGQTTLTVVHPPEHGAVQISDEPFFYVWPVNSPYAGCNQTKVAGHRAFYTANAGYTGNDRVVLEGSQPDGMVRRITVNISVR